MLYQVTKDRIFSADFTLPMLRELCERYLGMTPDAVTQLANQKLSKGSQTVKALAYAKLRTVALNKMGNGFAQTYPQWDTDGVVDLDFACLDNEPQPEPQPDPQPQPDQAPNFGANTRKRGAAGGTAKGPAHKGGVPRKGAYKVAHRPKTPSTNGGDAGKWEIWQHIWNCSTFEDFFAKAPAKGVTSATNRAITASMEMNWALKSGWIVIVQPDEQPAA